MSYHPAKVGGHSHSGSGVISSLVCHVILQDHVVKGSCDFMDGNPSWLSHHSAKFGDHRHCGSGDMMFLVLKRKIPLALASIRHYCLFLKAMG